MAAQVHVITTLDREPVVKRRPKHMALWAVLGLGALPWVAVVLVVLALT